MAVVIHVQRQHHVPAAAELNGVEVLHLRGVEVAVGGDHRGPRAGLARAFGQVQEAGQGALFGVKIDAGDRDLAKRRVEALCQPAEGQHDDQRDDQPQRRFPEFGIHKRLLLFAPLGQAARHAKKTGVTPRCWARACPFKRHANFCSVCSISQGLWNVIPFAPCIAMHDERVNSPSNFHSGREGGI